MFGRNFAPHVIPSEKFEQLLTAFESKRLHDLAFGYKVGFISLNGCEFYQSARQRHGGAVLDIRSHGFGDAQSYLLHIITSSQAYIATNAPCNINPVCARLRW